MAKQTQSENKTLCDNDTPVYSSRIIRVYLDYLRQHHPDINLEEIIAAAGIKPAQVDDPGFWYSQKQAVCMHEIMVAKTGNPQLSKAAGRYTAHSKALGKFRQFVLAFVSPLNVYKRLGKLYHLMSRGANLTVESLRPFKIRIITKPVPGIDEALFQCQNRLGTFEGLASAFSGRNARVSHTECLHAGGRHCEYIITWKPTRAFTLKKIKKIFVIVAGLLAAGLYFWIPLQAWGVIAATLAGAAMVCALLSDHFEKLELSNALNSHLEHMKEPLSDSDLMYNNALLVQKLGQEMARVFDLETYLKTVMGVMGKRLGFDRGAILLADKETRKIRAAASFGYSPEEEQLLNSAENHLARPQLRRFTIDLLKEGKSIIVNDLSTLAEKIPSQSYNFGTLLKSQACIAVPIRYESDPLGILLVDNITRKRTYYQSDVNFLEGIASQIAGSIVTARSYALLQESEEKFRMVFQTGPDAFTLNRYDDGVYVDVNEGFAAMTGFSREEVVGRTPTDLDIWASSQDRRHTAVEIGRQGSIDRFETRFNAKDGRTISGQISAKIVMLDQQKHVLSITRDISEMKQMESARKKLETQLRHSAKMESIGTLAGGIAHDFNNLMMGIRGNIDLMALDTEPTSDHYQRLKNIEQHVESGARLTRQLLGFAQVGKYDARPTDLNELAKTTVRMFARTRKEMSVQCDLADNIWAVDVDRGQIEQVLLNLFVNAWQAMPGGGDLDVRIRNRMLDNELARLLGIRLGPYVVMTVQDTGMGMAPAIQEKIFDPFFTTRPMGRGTGLGLASAYGIIKNHGGIITINSEEGVGATFRIYIPASDKKVFKEPERIISVEKGTGSILLVDDEEMITDVGKQLLERLGYSVLTAGSGKEAIGLLTDNHKKIDLVILDLIMPEMGGGETFDALRGLKPRMKVLLSSGYALEGEAADILARGCNGFIQKPFSLNDLSEKIRAILDGG
ncbi:MAG: response regulator [Desulfobacterales bacterium]|nr:response regulator [Desulfobacterales bacterium]